jgi:hypothetical protein
MIFRILLMAIALSSRAFAAFTEFYVQTTASNLNAGSTTSDSATYTGVGDSDGTNVFTPSDGSTPASTVSVNDWASVYVTSGATVATFIGRVTAVGAGVNGTITVSTTTKAGTFPSASAGAHTITCKVGGAWKGPNAAEAFPYAFVAGTMTDSTGANYPRVNFKAGTAYSITSAMTCSGTGPVWFQGYTSSPGDGGRAVFQGTTGAAYILLTISATNTTWIDLEWDTNGSTGGNSSSPGITITGARNLMQRCLVKNMRASGFNASNVCEFIECEAYNCNKSNTATFAGFSLVNSGARAIRCVSHDNGTSGSNSAGFRLDQSVFVEHCMAYGNFGDGFYSQADQSLSMRQCDAYNNARDGLRLDTASATLVLKLENSNFVKNGGYGINYNGSPVKFGYIYNCAFGSGTMANTSGTINSSIAPVEISGSITLPSNTAPWVDAANGNFQISAAVDKGTGRGTFYQTTTTPVNITVGYPDVGAAAAPNGGSYSF